MSVASAWSVALLGTQGVLIEVEAAVGSGLPRTILVGLADTALYEARDRCKAAVAGAGLSWPNQLVTINLTPADLPKAGSHYDLAITCAVLAAAEIVPTTLLDSTIMFGELGLDGRVRRSRGLLPGLMAARRAGMTRAIVPHTQAAEAALVTGITIWPVECLEDVIEVLHGRPSKATPAPQPLRECAPDIAPDLADVKGQDEACWALEVAAAGGHHIFFHGPPGVGKSMLAERLPGILPDLDDEAALEVSSIHSLSGASLDDGLIRRPPLCQPHHNATLAAMVGGGSRIAQPGLISQAHQGVLFLDEVPQFNPRVLDALRTPLESGVVTIARSGGQVSYPARFQLVLAANPCPCGMRGTRSAACTCTPMAIRRYVERLSGPILDRIDIHQRLMPASRSLIEAPPTTCTADVAARVRSARERQEARLCGTPWRTNASIPGYYLKKLQRITDHDLIDQAVASGQLSARGVDKVIRVAWTIADLAGHDVIERSDLAAAISFRSDHEWG